MSSCVSTSLRANPLREGLVPARVDFIEPLGSHVLVTAFVGEKRVIVHAPAGTELEPGTQIGLALPPERTYFFDAETGYARRERITPSN